MATMYRYWQDGEDLALDATDEDGAVEEARDWAREGWEPCEKTWWVHGALEKSEDGGETWSHVRDLRTRMDPDEPDCNEGEDHIYEHTGLRGNGGGVVVHETCSRCGLVRVTDTWAQDPYNGVQGLRSVKYVATETA